jgi:hypothetical protein
MFSSPKALVTEKVEFAFLSCSRCKSTLVLPLHSFSDDGRLRSEATRWLEQETTFNR